MHRAGARACATFFNRERIPPIDSFNEKAVLGTILLIVLILLLIGAIPTWPHSRNWGYVPSGGLGLIVIIILLLLTGRL